MVEIYMMNTYIIHKKITLDICDPNLKTVFYDFIYTIDYWMDYTKKNIGIFKSSKFKITGIIGRFIT